MSFKSAGACLEVDREYLFYIYSHFNLPLPCFEKTFL
jgi:hypothetical protein